MANFCGRCGTPLVAEQKFCPRCGTASGQDAAPGGPSATPPVTPKRGMTAALIAVLVLAGGGIATYVWTHRASVSSPGLATSASSVQKPFDLSSTPGAKFEVTYQPETVVLDPATTQKSFEAVNADGTIFVFNRNAPAIRSLHAGSVLLLQGLALKKVVAVEEHGESVIIATQQATLTDAIQDGHIHWDAPISFDAVGAQAGIPRSDSRASSWALSPGAMAMTPAWAVASATLPIALIAAPASGAEGDWKYTTKATSEAGQLNLDVDVKGATEGMTVDITGKGHVQSFGLMTDIQISHGVVEQFQYVAKNLRGDVTIDFLGKKSGDGMVKPLEIKLPTPFQAPLPIGGLPFVLSIGETIIVRPGFSGKNEIAQAQFKIRYGGGQGFSMSGPSMAAEGQPDDQNEISNSSSVAIAPFAYILAMAMPRIELTLGLEKATGFEALEKAIPAGIADRAAELLSKTTIGSQIAGVIKKTLKSEAAAHVEMVMVASHIDSGPLAMIPCKKTTFSMHANVGYDATALGKTAEGTKEIDLGEKQVIQQVPPNIRCGE